MTSYALGLDYGTDSVRALLVNALTGEEVATAVVHYKRWSKGLYCSPAKDQFRHHPLDYTEGLVEVVQSLWKNAPPGAAQQVVGMSFDTTGSTPICLNSDGVALALLPEFSENPNAMFVLWKDHTAVKEAQEITAAANVASQNYLKFEGGTIPPNGIGPKPCTSCALTLLLPVPRTSGSNIVTGYRLF
jgi:L-ribulokinase